MAISEQVQAVVDALHTHGFEPDVTEHEFDPAMSENGPYEVWARLQRGEVRVLVERNSSVEEVGGLRAMVEYPPVAVLTRGEARVACDALDLDLILAVAGDLDG